jgi:sensor histidine kinase YesM
MTVSPPARRASASPWSPRWADAAYAPGASALALLLLWYLHGVWLPWWALACGVGAGVLLRRVVAQGYAAFPSFLKRPLDAGVALVGTFLGCWITLVGYPIPYWILRWREALTLPFAAALLGLGIAAVVYTFRRLQLEIEEREARLAALREAELRARLRALQAQINPHFLFNSLNSLAEMVHGDADEAEQMVGDLAHLLRYSLRSSASGMVTLDQELESVRRYLRLERVRLGSRLRVEKDIEDGVGDTELPGLVLQPLVENAIKHAVAPRPEGGSLRISARRDAGAVVVVVRDDGPGLSDEDMARYAADASPSPDASVGTGGAGGGLASAQQRLALARRGELRVGRGEDGGTRIELRLGH